MGKLEVIFKIGLGHMFFFPRGIPSSPATIHFPETGNTVLIDPPGPGGPGEIGIRPPVVLQVLILRVERECTDEEGQDTSEANNRRFSIDRDAARALWRLFETLREIDYQHQYAPVYPVAMSERIEASPLVKSCEVEWIYDGERKEHITYAMGGSLQVTPETWTRAVQNLAKGYSVPAYRTFALDAVCFASSGDPVRAVIMACAAWETALREYLRTIASKKDVAYESVAKEQGIPRLYKYAKLARGGSLFHDVKDPKGAEGKKLVEKLPTLRNRLVHQGERDLPEGKPPKYADAVLGAIDWLFRDA